MNEKQLAVTIQRLNEGDLLDSLLNKIINDIALEIVATNPQQMSEREGLYLLSEAVKKLKGKLQEYENIYTNNFKG